MIERLASSKWWALFGVVAVYGLLELSGLVATGSPPEPPAEGADPRKVDLQEEAARPAGRTAEGREVVARVGGERITRREFDERLEALPEFVRARYKSAETKRKLLAAVAQFEALADIAERRGLGDSTATLGAMKSELRDLVVDRELDARLSAEEVSDEAVEEYYREHSGRYRRPERRRGLVIAADAEGRARRIRRELKRTAPGEERIETFREMASRRSADPATSGRGGSVGWLKPPDRESERPRIARAIFGLEERGMLSEVFRNGKRWYVATWDDRREADRRPLESVASDIRTRLYEERRERLRNELFDEWRSGTEIRGANRIREQLDAPERPRRTRVDEIPIRRADDIDSNDDSSNHGTAK